MEPRCDQIRVPVGDHCDYYMLNTRIFRVPDYYPAFACKCGDCRHTCCHGWTITVSMTEYFKLTGMNCSPGLRRSLDCALMPVDSPAPERYAAFNFDWRGDCRLHRECDGLCAIQRECGEDALPAICRMYPRAVHTRWAYECSVSCGCEAVSDLLIARGGELTFTEVELPVPPETERSAHSDFITEIYIPVREKCLALLQDRRFSLEERLAALDSFASAVDDAIAASDRVAILRALDSLNFANKIEAFDLNAAKLLANYYASHSPTLAPYARAAAEYYGTGNAVDTVLTDRDLTAQKYLEAEARRPGFDLAAENLLANELFHSMFPFNAASPRLAADALRALYLLLRYITAAADDSAYAVFRVADNSDFAAIAPRLLRGAKR